MKYHESVGYQEAFFSWDIPSARLWIQPSARHRSTGPSHGVMGIQTESKLNGTLWLFNIAMENPHF